MNYKSLAVASVLALANLGAFAQTYASTFNGAGLATFASGTLATSSPFTATINFTGLTSGTYDVIGDISASMVNFSSVSLDGHAWNVTNFPQFSFGYLEVTANQPVQLVLTGNSLTGNPNFSGSLQVTAVPEPESYAMLLAGLGAIGLVARRRNKADSA